MTGIQEQMLCSLCDSSLERCPCCGVPFCSAHINTSELCAGCEAEISKLTGRWKLTLRCFLAGIVALLVVCAVVLDGMLVSGLAAAAISVPMLLLLPDLLGQIARPFLVARRSRARRSTGDEAVVALPDRFTVR